MTDTDTATALLATSAVEEATPGPATCGDCFDAVPEPVEIVEGDRVIGWDYPTNPNGAAICSDCHADRQIADEVDVHDPEFWGLDVDFLYDTHREDQMR